MVRNRHCTATSINNLPLQLLALIDFISAVLDLLGETSGIVVMISPCPYNVTALFSNLIVLGNQSVIDLVNMFIP